MYTDTLKALREEAKGLTTTNQGGEAYTADDLKMVRRFAILGTTGGSYYANERDLTKLNLVAIKRAIAAQPDAVLEMVHTISTRGLAPSNDPAMLILTLALCDDNAETQAKARKMIRDLTRYGTNLFTFMSFIKSQRGLGSGLRKAIANYYLERTPLQVAYDVTKYASRTVQGQTWTHADVLRLVHPKVTGEMDGVFKYIVDGDLSKAEGASRAYLEAVVEMKSADKARSIELIGQYNLPREVVRTDLLNDPDIWEALLARMPYNAMVRNLGNMAKIGLLLPTSSAEKTVTGRLLDVNRIAGSKIHPLDIMKAKLIYGSGRGILGDGSWKVSQPVVAALETAFTASFGNVEPTNKNLMMALDVSSSMTWQNLGNVPGFTPRVAAAVLAMVNARVEPYVQFVGFSHELVDLPITRHSSLDEVIRVIEDTRYGATLCNLPMDKARAERLDIDAFLVYTDSDTGGRNPSEALRQYRGVMNKPDAKLVVVGMVANQFSIADPTDPNMLDVVGFDTSTPAAISAFVGD